MISTHSHASFFAAIVVSAPMLISCSSTPTTGDTAAIVRLHEARAAADVIPLFEPVSEHVREVVFEWNGITGGFDPTAFEAPSLEDAMRLAVQAHLRSLADVEADLSNRATSQNTVDPQNDLDALLDVRAALAKADVSSPYIVRLRVSQSADVAQALSRAGINADIYTNTREEDAAHTTAPPLSAQSLTHESWAPYGGGTNITQTSAYNTFAFNKNPFGDTETYEHETQVYEMNFATRTSQWSSNMPSAYLDTDFGDNNGVFVPTVGTFAAKSLKTYYTYYTTIALNKGSVSKAQVRIKGQKGHRFPSWCYSEWCVWADATSGSMANFYAPAGLSWQY